jgi:hypothetical protein
MLYKIFQLVSRFRWLLVGLAALLMGAYVTGRVHGVSAEKARQTAAQLKAEKQARRSDETAARQRVRDTTKIENEERVRNEAIEAAPNSAPDAASVALGCQRLRDARVRPLPAVCGN